LLSYGPYLPILKNMGQNDQSPLNDYDALSCLIRFTCASIFGIMVDIVIIALYGSLLLMGYQPWGRTLAYLLVGIPLIWGILGIFFFNDMLDLGKEICERFFLFRR